MGLVVCIRVPYDARLRARDDAIRRSNRKVVLVRPNHVEREMFGLAVERGKVPDERDRLVLLDLEE
jgi:hypothetical protein